MIEDRAIHTTNTQDYNTRTESTQSQITNSAEAEARFARNFDVMVDIKEKEQDLQAKMEQKYKAVLTETEHEVPLRTLYQGKKLKTARSRYWLVQCFGSFTRAEIDSFVKAYSKELTIDELEVINLYLKSLSGDREARNLLWEINKEIFKATKQVFIEQMRSDVNSNGASRNSRLDLILADIEKSVNTKIPQNAEIIKENDNNDK